MVATAKDYIFTVLLLLTCTTHERGGLLLCFCQGKIYGLDSAHNFSRDYCVLSDSITGTFFNYHEIPECFSLVGNNVENDIMPKRFYSNAGDSRGSAPMVEGSNSLHSF